MFDPTNMPIRSKPEGASRPVHEDTRAEYSVKCLARARCARFLAELFGVDDAGVFGRLGEVALYRELSLAASVLSIDEANLRPLFANRPPFEDVLDARNQLLGHTVRSACPPYELEYGQAEVFQQSQRLADMAGF